MSQISNWILVSLISSATLAIPACSSDHDTSTTEPTSSPTPTMSDIAQSNGNSRVVATVSLSPTHKVEFIANDEGMISMVESGAKAEASSQIDFQALVGLSAVEKFESLSAMTGSKTAAPAGLLAAQELSATKTDVLAPINRPAEADGNPEGKIDGKQDKHRAAGVAKAFSIDFNTEAAWFSGNFCSYADADYVWCPTIVGSATSGTDYGMHFDETCDSIGEGTTATIWKDSWNGSLWIRDLYYVPFGSWFRLWDDNVGYRRGGCSGSVISYSQRLRWGTPTFTAVNDYPFDRSMELSNDMQGVTHDATNWYFTGAKGGAPQNSRIWKTALTSDLNNQPPYYGNPFAGVYNHFGDLVHVNGKLYVALESGAGSATGGAIGVFNTALQYYGYGPIDAASPQAASGSVPWVAYNPKDGYFYSSKFDTSEIYKYRVTVDAGGPSRVQVYYVGKVALKNPNGTARSLSRVQGGKFSDSGKLYVTQDVQGGGIGVIDPNNGIYQTFVGVNFDRNGESEELEGIDIVNMPAGRAPGMPASAVHVIMVQNDCCSNDNWYFKHFSVSNFSRL